MTDRMTRSEFEKFLKESSYFSDVINTHRTATAQVVVALLAPLIKNGDIPLGDLLAILKQIECGTGHPSLDSERRHAVSVIREALQSLH